jgi:hypothetical protein
MNMVYVNERSLSKLRGILNLPSLDGRGVRGGCRMYLPSITLSLTLPHQGGGNRNPEDRLRDILLINLQRSYMVLEILKSAFCLFSIFHINNPLDPPFTNGEYEDSHATQTSLIIPAIFTIASPSSSGYIGRESTSRAAFSATGKSPLR